MIVAPIADAEAVNRIYADPWMRGKIDERSSYCEHPALTFYGAWISEELVGVFLAFRFSEIEREVHAALLRKALPHCRHLGALFLDKVFAERQVLRVTAQVIGGNGTAANYCRKLGFKLEGARRDACIQNNRVLPVMTLGLLRSDWTEKQAWHFSERRRHRSLAA